ncbi:MAG: type VI secretion system tip protein TssI/VgrG [Polyangiaceae bacterium]
MALRVTLEFLDDEGLGALFEVHRLEFSDAMSELYEAHLVAFSPDAQLSPRGLLGRRVAVHLADAPFLPVIRGVVRQARRHTTEAAGTTSYEITVVPPHWLLSRSRRTRIFQGRTASQMAADVLGGDPSTSGQRLTLPVPVERLGGQTSHDYRVQYGETDHDFVFRVLSEAGIAAFFDHASSDWVLCDDTSGGTPHLAEAIPFDPSNLTPAGPAVLRWCEIADVETGALARRDYDFEKPLFRLSAVRAAPGKTLVENEASLEDYGYEVGDFSDDGGGKTLAERSLDAARAMARRARMITNFAIGAGVRMTVTGPEIAGEWLVVESRSTQESNADGGTALLHEIVAIPTGIPYRPRRWPRPRIQGVETAFVVGDTPAGTVDTDGYGQVKVELRWDRRDLGKGNPTRWVRVAQAWAGPGFGLVTLPRVGDEVLIAYSQGDPDQPLVIGRVHNAVSVTPLSLPDPDRTKAIWKSQSFGPSGPVEGYNMISMDDAAAAELVEIRAQLDRIDKILRDFSTYVGRNRATLIRGDDQLEVQGHQEVKVIGNSQTGVKGSSSSTSGKLDIDSKSTLSIHSKGDMRISTDSDRTDQTGSNHFITAGSVYMSAKDVVQVNAEHFHVFGRSSIKLVCGGSAIVIEPGSIQIVSSGPVNVNGGVVKLNCE